MRMTRPGIFQLFLLMCLVSGSAAAYDGRVPNPASIEAMKQVLRLSSMDKIIRINIRRGVEDSNRKDPGYAVDTEVYLSFATPDAIVDRFAPQFAPYLAADYASKLITGFQTPAGRQVSRLALIEAEYGYGAANAEFKKLPPQTQRIVTDFQRGTVYTSLRNAETRAQGDVRAEFHRWTAEVVKARLAQVHKELANILEIDMRWDERNDTDEAGADETYPLPEKLVARTGMRTFDAESQTYFIAYRQNADLNRQMRRSMKGLQLEDILKPEYLASREGIEVANLRLLSLDGLLDSYTKISESILDNFNRNLDKVSHLADQRKDVREGNVKALTQAIEDQVKENEMRRTLIELVKRAIEFCEQRIGKTVHKDGELLFHDDKDVDAYNDLVAQVNRQISEIKRIADEQRVHRKALIEKMRLG